MEKAQEWVKVVELTKARMRAKAQELEKAQEWVKVVELTKARMRAKAQERTLLSFRSSLWCFQPSAERLGQYPRIPAVIDRQAAHLAFDLESASADPERWASPPPPANPHSPPSPPARTARSPPPAARASTRR